MSYSTFYHFTAALQSVFPQTELGTFMSLTKRDKERQLNELTLIVTGIRLFNRECGKGGEGIDDRKLTKVEHTDVTGMYSFLLYAMSNNLSFQFPLVFS